MRLFYSLYLFDGYRVEIFVANHVLYLETHELVSWWPAAQALVDFWHKLNQIRSGFQDKVAMPESPGSRRESLRSHSVVTISEFNISVDGLLFLGIGQPLL